MQEYREDGHMTKVQMLREQERISGSILQKGRQRVLKNFYELDHSLNVQICQVRYNAAQNILEKHLHVDSYEIVYMMKGQQTYIIDGQPQVVSTGQLVISPPNVCHTTGYSPEEKSRFYYVTIGKETLSSLFSFYPEEQAAFTADFCTYCAQKQKVYAMHQPALIGTVCDRMIALHGYDTSHPLSRIRSALQELMFLTMDSLSKSQSAPTGINGSLQFITQYIDEHTGDSITVSELARMANYSYSEFGKRFKAQSGYTVHDYILRKKIEKAKSLLLDNSLTPAQTAAVLSFSSERYFAEVFKRYTTLTPARFVRQNTKSNKNQ